MGLYLLQVLDANGRTWLDPVLRPLERGTYRVMGVDPNKEHDWKQYTLAMLLFSLVGCLFTYAILRLQYLLPLNPQGLAGVEPGSVRSTLRPVSPPTPIGRATAAKPPCRTSRRWSGWHFTISSRAATGIAIAAALVRGIARHTATHDRQLLGRSRPRDLLPAHPDLPRVRGLPRVAGHDPKLQAVHESDAGRADESFGRQSATRMAKPIVDADGKAGDGRADRHRAKHRAGPDGIAGRDQDARHKRRWLRQCQRGASVRKSDAALKFLPDVVDLFHRQRADLLPRPNGEEPEAWLDGLGGDARAVYRPAFCWRGIRKRPAIRFINNLGVAAADGNMEGKEVRFGIFNSALFATITTDASCGAVNSMHDSFTPLGGFVPLFNIQLGEIIFGGVGAGLYGMLVFVVLAVFIAGLMVGRTPEYLGKKIESYDVKMAMLALLILAIDILAFSAWAIVSKWGLAGLNNNGPHGFSEILYAFTSGTGNNGSAFAGISANTPWLQHHPRYRHVDRTLPDDRADPRPGRFVSRKRRSRRPARARFRFTAAHFSFCSSAPCC